MGRADTEPTGIAGDCFFVLAMYTGQGKRGLTPGDLHEAIVAENESLGCAAPTRAQVRGGLHATLAKRGLAQLNGRRWEITDHGWKMLDVWAGADEPDPVPVRRPCGLGWPMTASL